MSESAVFSDTLAREMGWGEIFLDSSFFWPFSAIFVRGEKFDILY
jgi:hypothetical protein